jgi:hypothetical protein
MLVSINIRSQIQTYIGILNSLVGCIAKAMGVMRSSFPSGKLTVNEGAALREAGAKFSNISRSGRSPATLLLELLHFHISRDMYT